MRREYAAALAVFAVVFGLTVLVSIFYERAATEDARVEASALASEVRARCEGEIADIIYLSSGLEAYFVVHGDRLDDAEVEAMLAELYAHRRHVRNFGVAEGYVLRYVYPRQGNEAAIGLDYRKLPQQLPAVQEAIDRRTAILSPKVDLVQGGSAIIYRMPIFVHERYWGLLSTVIDIDDLLHTALARVDVKGERMAIVQTGTLPVLLWGDPALGDRPQTLRLKTDFGWEIQLLPSVSEMTWVVVVSLWLVSASLGLLIALGLFSTLRSRRELHAASTLQTAILEAADVGIIAETPNGVISLFNRAAERMLGYRADEVIGHYAVATQRDTQAPGVHAWVLWLSENSAGFEPAPDPSGVAASEHGPWSCVRRDGSRFPALLAVTAIHGAETQTQGYLHVISDVTEHERQDRAIRAALHEKETLLKEVYHRVKNNLQVITSLFNLQSRAVPEGLAREALCEGAERVRAMALVHEMLYQSESLAAIDVDTYVRALCRDLSRASGAIERGIRFDTVIESILIPLETAVPLGLLINELVSNSLKHGFPERRGGTIGIRIQQEEMQSMIVEICDDGIGYEANGAKNHAHSLGLRLVETLSRQLDGQLKIDNRQGTHVQLCLKIPPVSVAVAQGRASSPPA